MKFLDKYECEDMHDGNFCLNIIPNPDFETIEIYVNKHEFITIFDGGSTINALRMIYNFSSKKFLNAFEEILKRNKVSCEDEVLFLECDECDFETRLNDFINAVNEICNI